MSVLTADLDAAYAHCEEITRREARNFAYGLRLLPEAKRRAMGAVYALARRIDDIGDGDRPVEEKLRVLAEVRTLLDDLRTGAAAPGDLVLVALGDAATRFPIPLEVFDEVVLGCERDATGTRYETFDDLVDYCRLVAGSIGRLSLGVFGAEDLVTARVLADDLGVALQLTNVLRDVAEDRAMGRVYLPTVDVERFGAAPDLSGPRAAVAELVRFEAERAQDWFARGLALLPLLDRRSRACAGAMAGIYRHVLCRIQARPEAVLDGRVSLPAWEKAWVAARSLVGIPA